MASTKDDTPVLMTGNEEELLKLRAFFKAVALLTSNHDVIETDDDGYAVVFPNKLGPELEKIDKEWWKIG